MSEKECWYWCWCWWVRARVRVRALLCPPLPSSRHPHLTRSVPSHRSPRCAGVVSALSCLLSLCFRWTSSPRGDRQRWRGRRHPHSQRPGPSISQFSLSCIGEIRYFCSEINATILLDLALKHAAEVRWVPYRQFRGMVRCKSRFCTWMVRGK